MDGKQEAKYTATDEPLYANLGEVIAPLRNILLKLGELTYAGVHATAPTTGLLALDRQVPLVQNCQTGRATRTTGGSLIKD